MTAAEDLLPRPASRADLPAVLALYWSYDEAFRGGRDTDESDVSDEWETPGFDFAARTVVYEQNGTVVAYGVVDHSGSGDTVADPARRDLGLEDRLLAWLESRAAKVEHYLPDTDPELDAVFRRRGWIPARRFWRMRLGLDRPSPEPLWPPGVQVRPYERPADDVATHTLIEACFAEIGGQHRRTLEQWSVFLLATAKFDPELCLVAVAADGQAVGAAMSQDAGDYGFVRQLAVAPAYRGRGLGLALLHECFRRHAARGLPATVLYVDAANPTGALALYEKAGMSVVENFVRWEWTPGS